MLTELERIWKEAVVVYLRYYLGVCLEGLRKPRKSTSRIVGVPAEIRTELSRIQVYIVNSRPFCSGSVREERVLNKPTYVQRHPMTTAEPTIHTETILFSSVFICFATAEIKITT
jgi:hypothetical protein